MAEFRIERDLLGEKQLPAAALYGIYTLRAMENFPLSRRPVHPALISAYGAVKLACIRTNASLGFLSAEIAAPLEQACHEMIEGTLAEHILADALQGGAGTSTNMNVNEVLANRALLLLGRKPGEYNVIHPLEHVNLHQSTNDTYPTALKVAAIQRLRPLQEQLSLLVHAFQSQEHRLADVVKVARTQMQDAVLTTLGREMSAYAEAFARDRWRIFKCEERLRVVNLGGTAIGTGILAPRDYIFRVVEELRSITGLGLSRAENLIDATQNNDMFVEVSGILKACASNLLKIAGDIRFLSSGPQAGIAEIQIPPRQAGSSIMPGKVNPVIPEAVSQAAMMAMGCDSVIAHAVSMGHLELNPFLPLIADALLHSIDLLANACEIFRRNCVEGMEANPDRCRQHVESGTAVLTALAEELGYEKAQLIAQTAAAQRKTIRQVVLEQNLLSEESLNQYIQPGRVTRLGFPPKKESP